MTNVESKARRKAIAAAIAGGMGCFAAARRFGVSRALVSLACAEYRVAVAPRRLFSSYRVLAALINTGEPLAAVAARHGVSRQRVGEVYRAAGAAGIHLPVRRVGALRKGAAV